MRRRKFLIMSALGLAGIGLTAAYWNRRWQYIVIHHSAGDFGSIEFLQQVHRERQPYDPIDAIPYHYLIGNGNGLGMGEVASDRRQKYGLWGTHLSANNSYRNFLGLGICLIGNFERNDVPSEQFKSLVELTRDLMSRYSIPAENVIGHGMISGESTLCPGQRFPMASLTQAVS